MVLWFKNLSMTFFHFLNIRPNLESFYVPFNWALISKKWKNVSQRFLIKTSYLFVKKNNFMFHVLCQFYSSDKLIRVVNQCGKSGYIGHIHSWFYQLFMLLLVWTSWQKRLSFIFIRLNNLLTYFNAFFIISP